MLKLETTTAMRKISKLKKRIWCVQGGQGSSKTFSILQILINHASSNPDKEIYIVSAQLSKMKLNVIKDFVKIMKAFYIFDKKNWIGDTLYRFPNGSTIKFFSLDKEDIGKGVRSDIVFFNEANKVDFETYSELSSRAKRIIIDYNPNRIFWAHEDVITRDDCDFINLTFLDNECLDENERNEILEYYNKGYDDDGNVINEFFANKWRVYGLGEIGRLSGAIFQNWKLGKFDDSFNNGYGLDFGSSDPDALVHVSIDINKCKKIYVKELMYKSNQSTDSLISNISSIITNKNKLIIADSAGKRTIDDIKLKGFNIKRVIKDPIIEDIKLLQGYELIVDPLSTNLIIELENYVWLDKKSDTPIDKFNHLIDALRYIAKTLISPPKVNTHKLMRRSR